MRLHEKLVSAGRRDMAGAVVPTGCDVCISMLTYDKCKYKCLQIQNQLGERAGAVVQGGRDTILIRFLLHPPPSLALASPPLLLLLLHHYLHIDQLPMQGGLLLRRTAVSNTKSCCFERNANGCFRERRTVGYCPQHSRGK